MDDLRIRSRGDSLGFVALGALALLVCTGADWRGVPENRDEKNKLRKGREEAAPDRCRTVDRWKKSRKDSGDDGGGGVVGGTGGEQEIEPFLIHHQWDHKFFCGEEVQGLDNNFYDDDYFGRMGTGRRAEAGLRAILGYAVHQGRVDSQVGYDGVTTFDDERLDLMRVVLRHQCFSRTQYNNAAEDYPTYHWCRRRTESDAMPSRSRVKELLEKHLSGREFERKNFLFLYDRGEEMRKKVVKGFGKFEENFPIVKKVYDGGTEKGMKRYESLRKEFSSVYDKLAPITEKLENGENPPEGCGAELEKVQNEVAEKVGVEPTVEAVTEFRAKHPLGRQLTEALAFCYSRDKHAERRFDLEKKLLEQASGWHSIGKGLSTDQFNTLQAEYMTENPGKAPTRELIMEYAKKKGALGGPKVPPARITKIQHVVHARQDVFEAEKGDAELPAFLDGVTAIPDVERTWLAKERPEIEYQAEKTESRRSLGVPYEKDGHYEKEEQRLPPPLVTGIQDVPVGKQVEFKHETFTSSMETCDNWKTTDRIESIEYEGGEQVVNYEQVCTKSSVKTGEYEKGFEPAIVTGWEAELIEKGLQLHLWSDGADPKDSVVVDAWNKESGEPVILKGVLLKQ